MQETFEAVVALENGYAFRATFPDKMYESVPFDEPAPLGADSAPNAARMLAASVGTCLGASLLLCLRKSHAAPSAVSATVRGSMERNENGRWRIASLDVTVLAKDVDEAKLARCAGVFEDYCIVTQSVRQGIPVNVRVSAG